MGRKLLLTVRKRRSNERQKSKERKLHLLKLAEEARKIKYVYGGPLESKGGHSCESGNGSSQQMVMTANKLSNVGVLGAADDSVPANVDQGVLPADVDVPVPTYVDDVPADVDVWYRCVAQGALPIDVGVPVPTCVDDVPADVDQGVLPADVDVPVPACVDNVPADVDQGVLPVDVNVMVPGCVDDLPAFVDDIYIPADLDDVCVDDNVLDFDNDKESLSSIDDDGCCGGSKININVSADVSIDLPPLNWTFQHDLRDLDCIGGIDTEQPHDQTSNESPYQQSLSVLKYSLQYGEPIGKWFVLPTEDPSKIYLCTYNFNIALSPVVTFTIEILYNHEWVLRIPYGALNWRNHPVFKEMPAKLVSQNDVKAVTDTIDDCKQCEGISDKRYDSLVIKYKGKFYDFSGKKLLAYYDNQYSTIRHTSCLWLCDSCYPTSSQCSACHKYQRNVLNSALATASNKLHTAISPGRSSTQSHTNYRFCSTPEKTERLRKLHHTVCLQNKVLQRLKDRLDMHIASQGVIVEDPIHNDLVTIMKKQSESVLSQYGEESFQGIFWSQQLKATAATKASGRRWHPLIIKWCLYLHHVSSKAYETIRNSGVVTLPSSRTLRDYKHLSSTNVGFSVEADRQLVDILAQKDDLAKYGMLLFDEMYVKQGLVYEKSTGALFGFTDLGEVNNQLIDFEQSLSSDGTGLQRPLAKSMLVFMFKGLFTNIAMPYAQFPACSLKGVDMFPLLWEAIGRLSRLGCCVLGVTCDAGSPNRRLFQMHQTPDTPKNKIIHKAKNMFKSDPNEPTDILFFTDPPHLLKTIRNCFENPNRKLWCNGREIKWQHIVNLYERNTGRITETPGLSIVHKLKYEHIKLTNFSKMRVDLAAQVMSSSVAKALKLTGGDEAVETANFIELVDKLFDCLNVSSLSKGRHQRKAFAQPYRKLDDFRIDFLRNELLPYFDKWETSVAARTEFSKEERNLMLLSRESRHGITLTVSSFLELYQFIFNIPGVSCFLSNRICQDPLEKYFGMQRQSGGTNDNPTIMEFAKNSDTLRLVGNMWFDDSKGNCRKSNSVKQCIEDTKTLPLRKRQQKPH